MVNSSYNWGKNSKLKPTDSKQTLRWRPPNITLVIGIDLNNIYINHHLNKQYRNKIGKINNASPTPSMNGYTYYYYLGNQLTLNYINDLNNNDKICFLWFLQQYETKIKEYINDQFVSQIKDKINIFEKHIKLNSSERPQDWNILQHNNKQIKKDVLQQIFVNIIKNITNILQKSYKFHFFVSKNKDVINQLQKVDQNDNDENIKNISKILKISNPNEDVYSITSVEFQKLMQEKGDLYKFITKYEKLNNKCKYIYPFII